MPPHCTTIASLQLLVSIPFWGIWSMVCHCGGPGGRVYSPHDTELYPMTDFPLALTFDDVLLQPGHSRVLPHEADITTRLVRDIHLNIPFLSSAMDTVTESATAIAMAQEGGIGVIHKNMSPEKQAHEVSRVKRTVSGMIVDPITLAPEASVGDAVDLMRRHDISGVPITKGSRLVGILTNRDLRFRRRVDDPVGDVMTKGPLVTVPEGTTLEESKDLLLEHKIQKLLVVDDQFNLVGLITTKDIEKSERFPIAAKDGHGRLRVAAAVGVGADRQERVQALVDAGVDIIVVDTAHGHSQMVLDAISDLRSTWPDVPMVAGNVATAEATEALIKVGADAVKVGIGPGSICTTRVVTGVGVPQVSAIEACARVAKKHDIPIISDGGVKYSGDAAKALAAGADAVMIGSLFAGTEESPGDVILLQGRRYKVYRGMGSIEAMRAGSADRYFQEGENYSPLSGSSAGKLVPEGIVGRVPFRGSLSDILYQLVGGLRSSLGYTGCATLADFKENSQFVRITNAGLRESHVHDVIITEEAPNYRLE